MIRVLLVVFAAPAWADAPMVEAASFGGGSVSATISHPDTGWEHYADGFRVELEDGTVLGVRELLHPHETEQPFTRSLAGVEVPEGTRVLMIRARCLVDGWSDEAFRLTLD